MNKKGEEYYNFIGVRGKPEWKPFYTLSQLDEIREIVNNEDLFETYSNSIKGNPKEYFDRLRRVAMNSSRVDLVNLPLAENPFVVLIIFALFPMDTENTSFAKKSIKEFLEEEMMDEKKELLELLVKAVLEDQPKDSLIYNRGKKLVAELFPKV